MEKILADLRSTGPDRRRAVEALYRDFSGRLRRYFANHRATPAEAEDWTQEVFVRVLRSSQDFRGDGLQFVAWLWTIARRILFDAGRVRPKGEIDIDDVEDGEQPQSPIAGPAEEVERGSTQDCVRAALRRFSDDHPERAQSVSWLVTDGLSVADLAGVLGRTPGATREFLSQCRKKLRAYLQHCFDADMA